jgi:hypothetical protein
MTVPGYRYLGATFDGSHRYRYVLRRAWDPAMGDKGHVCFIGLNPSTADERTDDPTVRRCVRYAHRWGYSSMVMLNIFALRSTDPQLLYAELDPVGNGNNGALAAECRAHPTLGQPLVVACWGTHGAHRLRGREVRQLLRDYRIPVHHLGLTKEGHPRHPLYLRNDVEPQRWT